PIEQGQPDRLAGGALGRRQARAAHRLQAAEGQADLWSLSDRGADRPGPADLAAVHPLEPERLPRDPRQLARGPDREVPNLRPADLPPGRVRQDSATRAGRRRGGQSAIDAGLASEGAVGGVWRFWDTAGGAASTVGPGAAPSERSLGYHQVRERP